MIRNKYSNKKITIDGLKFDSKKEGKRYTELKLLEAAGEITNLEMQKRFEIIPKQAGERASNYIADFVYYDFNKQRKVIEDVKGFKTDVYKLKRKLVKLKYPDYEFIES